MQFFDTPPLERTNTTLFAVGIIIALSIVAGSVILLIASLHTPTQTGETPHAATTPAGPSVFPTPAFHKQDVTFEVLNGSGIAGAAAKAADKIIAAGYPVVSVGNADSATYATSKLYLTGAMQSHADQIISDLSVGFGISSVSGILTDSTASARIIVGKK